MNFSDRIITSLPFENIWTDNQEINAERTFYLKVEDITHFLNESTVQFVIADVGCKLVWVDLKNRFEFWKSEVHDSKKKLKISEILNII